MLTLHQQSSSVDYQVEFLRTWFSFDGSAQCREQSAHLMAAVHSSQCRVQSAQCTVDGSAQLTVQSAQCTLLSALCSVNS